MGLVAAKAGADYLGMVFVPGVRREVSIETSKHIVETLVNNLGDEKPMTVGLFAGQPLNEINDIVSYIGLDFAQLCGNEPIEYCNGVSIPVIKQVKIPENCVPDSLLKEIEIIVSSGHKVLMDKYEPGVAGGTGKTFDWNIAKLASEQFEIILAGGLTPTNVAEAIRKVNPWCVDVSSGVESNGLKDSSKIIEFATSVKKSD